MADYLRKMFQMEARVANNDDDEWLDDPKPRFFEGQDVRIVAGPAQGLTGGIYSKKYEEFGEAPGWWYFVVLDRAAGQDYFPEDYLTPYVDPADTTPGDLTFPPDWDDYIPL